MGKMLKDAEKQDNFLLQSKVALTNGSVWVPSAEYSLLRTTQPLCDGLIHLFTN